MEKLARNHAVDIEKGIAIILVIVGHIKLTPELMRVWLYSFHMPLFFIVSGVLFSTKKYQTFKEFLVAKVKSLLVPYFLLQVALWLLMFLYKFCAGLIGAELTTTIYSAKDFALSLLLGNRLTNHYFSMWFIVVLFVAQLILYFVTKALKERWYAYVALAIITIGGSYFLFQHVQGFYHSLDLVPVALGFLAVGYAAKQFSQKGVNLYRAWTLPLMIALNLAAGFINYRYYGMPDLYNCQMGHPALYLVAGITGSWAVASFAHIIETSKFLEFFGKNSLTVYAFNNDFAIPMACLVSGYFAEKLVKLADPIFVWIFTIALALAITAALAAVVNRLCPWLVGKKRRAQ